MMLFGVDVLWKIITNYFAKPKSTEDIKYAFLLRQNVNHIMEIQTLAKGFRFQLFRKNGSLVATNL